MRDSPLFTPEQVAQKLQVTVTTVYRWLRSNKLPGINLGRKTWRVRQSNLDKWLEHGRFPELLFEEYLREQGLGPADRHPSSERGGPRLDYRLLHQGRPLWFEVAAFVKPREPAPDFVGPVDPLAGIPEKISHATEKFSKVCPDGSCCVVLFNNDVSLVFIEPEIILGAMLGQPGVRVGVDLSTGTSGPSESVFIGGGKAVGPDGTPQNRSLAAVFALERFAMGQRRFSVKKAERESEMGRRVTRSEFCELLSAERTLSESVVRVTVCENPYAASPLPRDIFVGKFDERWGVQGGYVKRVFVGSALEELEAREGALGLHMDPGRGLLGTSNGESDKPGGG